MVVVFFATSCFYSRNKDVYHILVFTCIVVRAIIVCPRCYTLVDELSCRRTVLVLAGLGLGQIVRPICQPIILFYTEMHKSG